MLKWKWQWPHVHVTVIPLQERHFVTLAIFLLALGMLMMARENPDLWEVDLFTIILQAVVISGIIGSILAFHFAANKKDVVETETAARTFELESAAARADARRVDVPADAAQAADQVAAAAEAEAQKITEG